MFAKLLRSHRPDRAGVSLPTQVSVSVTSLVDLAWSPGSAVPRSSVSTAVWHFEYRHEFRHAAERTFTSYMSYGDECRQIKGIGTCPRARILKAGYNQLGGIFRAGLYRNFVVKKVLFTFCVSNNKLGGEEALE